VVGVIVGLALALACAVATSVALLLKHRGAVLAPDVRVRHPLRSAIDLFRSGWFAVGWAVAIGAWVLHVGALALAPPSIVQAVLSGGLVQRVLEPISPWAVAAVIASVVAFYASRGLHRSAPVSRSSPSPRWRPTSRRSSVASSSSGIRSAAARWRSPEECGMQVDVGVSCDARRQCLREAGPDSRSLRQPMSSSRDSRAGEISGIVGAYFVCDRSSHFLPRSDLERGKNCRPNDAYGVRGPSATMRLRSPPRPKSAGARA
jgi:hypothetical protein